MKWGVRRYQNKDGTLTVAGRKRYLNSDGSAFTKEGRKKYYKDRNKLDRSNEREAAREERRAKREAEDLSKLSQEELAQKIERARMEKELATLKVDIKRLEGGTTGQSSSQYQSFSAPTVKQGGNFLVNAVQKEGGKMVNELTAAGGRAAINKFFKMLGVKGDVLDPKVWYLRDKEDKNKGSSFDKKKDDNKASDKAKQKVEEFIQKKAYSKPMADFSKLHRNTNEYTVHNPEEIKFILNDWAWNSGVYRELQKQLPPV
jgi:hypothetical protein